jgi:hypothetical protein
VAEKTLVTKAAVKRNSENLGLRQILRVSQRKEYVGHPTGADQYSSYAPFVERDVVPPSFGGLRGSVSSFEDESAISNAIITPDPMDRYRVVVMSEKLLLPCPASTHARGLTSGRALHFTTMWSCRRFNSAAFIPSSSFPLALLQQVVYFPVEVIGESHAAWIN